MKPIFWVFSFVISAGWGLSPLKKVVLVDNMYNVTADPPLFKDRIGTRALVQREGAVLHTYRVTTVDGYILQLNRLVMKTPEEMKAMPGKGIPVVIVHGALAAFDIWLIDGKKVDFPFLLAEKGFDPWMVDKRGNYFSRLHETLSKDDPRFWNFTAHENGVIDLPAFIDAVIEVTHQPKVIFIGHSSAGIDFAIMESAVPEYNDKILFSLQFACIPISFNMNNVETPLIRIGLTHNYFFHKLINQWNILETLPRRQSIIDWVLKNCGGPPLQEFCIDLFDMGSGPHRSNIDRKRIAMQMSRWPAGGAVKPLFHVLQMAKTGFRQYNYGTKENMKIYGTPLPPRYHKENIRSPMVWYYARNDPVNANLDVEQLRKDFPGMIMLRTVRDPGFNHIDYIFGKNRKEVVYEDAIEVMLNLTERYSNHYK